MSAGRIAMLNQRIVDRLTRSQIDRSEHGCCLFCIVLYRRDPDFWHFIGIVDERQAASAATTSDLFVD
jgi:hypothetical protein